MSILSNYMSHLGLQNFSFENAFIEKHTIKSINSPIFVKFPFEMKELWHHQKTHAPGEGFDEAAQTE